MSDFEIAQARPSDPEAMALIRRHLDQMAAQSPQESCHAMDSSGLEGPEVQFYVLRRSGAAIGMGALKRLAHDARELKSMHTVSEARGLGAGRAMLEHLIGLAREEKAEAIYLETGSTPEFLPARKLYETYGFVECPPFGDYSEDPWSTFMHLDLRAAP